jgi:hypothetical protein
VKQEQLAASALYPHDGLDRGPRGQPVQDSRDGHPLDGAGRAEPAADESAALLIRPGPPISTCSTWPYGTSASTSARRHANTGSRSSRKRTSYRLPGVIAGSGRYPPRYATSAKVTSVRASLLKIGRDRPSCWPPETCHVRFEPLRST